ncbi:MAG: methyl-accepting chemotaxis protein [Ignavibacteriaceae bacterium]
MSLSISRKMGIIVAATLGVTLSIMIFVLLTKEEKTKTDKAKQSVSELSDAITQSIIYAMGEGVTDIQPFIERSKKIKNIKELRIISTDKITAGSEASMDSREKAAIVSKRTEFLEEEFEGEEVCRSIQPILAEENCLNCHDANLNDPLATVSLRYTMKQDYEAIASQRLEAILMGLATIIIAFLMVMIFLKRQFIRDLLISVNEIKRLSTGDINSVVEIKRDDELGELSHSVKVLQNSLKQHSEAAAQIAAGNVDISVNMLSDNDVLGKAMITVKESLSSLLQDIKGMSSAASEGNLGQRLNAERHCGSYNALIAGCNNTLDFMHTPIDEGTDVLARMAAGDFTARMNGDYRGDFARLKSSINSVAESMTEALSKITESVHATASASTEISSSTEEMAAGSQEQSSQTREIAASIEQMTKTIIETTRNATTAAENAKKAGQIAGDGGKVVEDTVEGMKKIAEVVSSSAETVKKLGKSSDQIGEIIQVIDDIADQTNLLALNAAIEAARAGEQGRGFAVVADEVRKLAERTTKATKEIAEMIKQIQKDTLDAVSSMNKGTEEVDKGRKLANSAGESLKEIITASAKVLDDVTQVASASEEQSAAAEEVSRNIEAISNVTHETAAGIQQVAGAAEDLNRLTDNLQKLISKFKIDSAEKETHYSVRQNGKLVEG